MLLSAHSSYPAEPNTCLCSRLRGALSVLSFLNVTVLTSALAIGCSPVTVNGSTRVRDFVNLRNEKRS